MRILIVNHEFTISGASTLFWRLARHLRGQGHELALLPCIPTDGPMKPRFEALGVPVVSEVVLAEFDVAICNGICSAPYVVQMGAHLPTIWLVHEAEVALTLLLRNQDWIPAFAAAATVLYETPYQAEILRSFTISLDTNKFHVVPNGVEVFPELLARDKIPAKQRALRAVQAGTMEPRKRPGDFIRAVAASGLDMEAVICGTFYNIDDEAMAIVEAEPEKYKLLSGLPNEELLAWVESADMFCLASGSETQGIAVYEAALLQRALLLSDLPCYENIFRHGRNCLMFPPGHITMLALSMRSLAASAELRVELGAAAQRTAREFTTDKYHSRIDGLLAPYRR
jgi:glycosyltransferase involved in cell wall biosynthesis